MKSPLRELIMNERGIDNRYENRPGSMGDEQERLWASPTRQGLKQEAVGLPGGSAYDQGDDYRHDGARDRLRHRLRQSDANGSPRQIP